MKELKIETEMKLTNLLANMLQNRSKTSTTPNKDQTTMDENEYSSNIK